MRVLCSAWRVVSTILLEKLIVVDQPHDLGFERGTPMRHSPGRRTKLPAPGPFPRIPRRRSIVLIVILVVVGTIFVVDSQLAMAILDVISIGLAGVEIARPENAVQLLPE